mgnify:CR=1 FL=1
MGAFLDKVPHFGGLPLFQHILGACRKWKNVELGRFAFDHTILLDENITAAYTLMAAIYADVGMHNEAKMLKAIESK